MLDIKFIRENPDKVREGLKKKGVEFDLDYLLQLDEKRRAKIKEVDDLRAEQNAVSDEIAGLSGKSKEKKVAEMKELKSKLGDFEFELKALDTEFSELMFKIPNLPLDEVPVGKDEKDNVEIRVWGKKRDFDFTPKDHLELGAALGIIDFETGAKVSGSGFYYLKNEGVMLELALVHYTLDFLRRNNFTLWLTPDMARRQFYLGTGYLPKGPEAQTYEISESDLGLIATSEVTLAGIHADEILEKDSLPRRYAGYSHCFRQEAGGYGKYSKGLYRVHQFTKVEMFAYTRPEESSRMHEEFLELEEELWQGLEIPYRVVEMCAGDLGAQAARKFDIEAWMPGRGDWGEVTSTSNTTDYQARNLAIRYRAKNGDVEFAHTLNGTAIATSRAIIAILENYQDKDGSARIPDVLLPYMGGITAIKRSL